MRVTLRPIGHVRAGRDEVRDDHWADVTALIELDPAVVGDDAARGLDEFSHIEVVYLFDRVDPGEVITGARRPRGNPAWPEVGILAQRAKARPNRLGVSRCEVLGVDTAALAVRGLDAVDGSPVLDIKPWMEEFAPRGPVRQPDWSHELMVDYWNGGPVGERGDEEPR